MRGEDKSTRFHERIKLEIPLEVTYSESAEITWREQTQTEEVTFCGGSFTLSHPVEPHRLVNLKMPLPRHFRLFDFGTTQYNVWAVIRHVRLIESDDSGKIRMKVGVAFTGNKPPKSFLLNPTTRYDLKPILRKENFWDLRELPRSTGPYFQSMEDRRPIEIKVILETISDDGRILEIAQAETLNISESGMALKVEPLSEIPRYVVIKTGSHNLSLLAKVRGANAVEDDSSLRLHIEFISGKWFV